MKLLHFADLHLDAPFAWASPETARSRRRNRREALTQIVALAEAESVDAILSAGDLFEQDRIGPDTVEFLRSTFERTDRRVYPGAGQPRLALAAQPVRAGRVVAERARLHRGRAPAGGLDDGLTLWGAAHRAPANTDDLFPASVSTAAAYTSPSPTRPSARPWRCRSRARRRTRRSFDAAELPATGLAHAFLGHYHVPRDAELHTYPA